MSDLHLKIVVIAGLIVLAILAAVLVWSLIADGVIL